MDAMPMCFVCASWLTAIDADPIDSRMLFLTLQIGNTRRQSGSWFSFTTWGNFVIINLDPRGKAKQLPRVAEC